MDSSPTGGRELGGTVKIKRGGKAEAGEHLVTDRKAAVEIFLVTEEPKEGLPRGIIGTEQEGGLVLSEPPVGRPVEEEHLSFPEGTVPPLPVTLLPPYLATETERAKPETQRLPVDRDPFFFLEHLRQVREVEVLIPVLGHRDHLLGVSPVFSTQSPPRS
jgi:hypothetical protein